MEKFELIAKALKGYTTRSVISILDFYRKAQKRLRLLKEEGFEIVEVTNPAGSRFNELMGNLKILASQSGMEIYSCAEELDLSTCGIQPGKCIDDALILKVFNLNVTEKKDPGQREVCGCVVSKDIGMYDTCLFGCQYCYATQSFERAKSNFEEHDPNSPSLIGWHDAAPPSNPLQPDLL